MRIAGRTFSTKETYALAIMGFVTVTFAAIFIGVIVVGDVPLGSRADLCPATGETALTLLVIDVTDPLTTRHESSLRQLVEKLIDDSSKDTRLSLHTIASTSGGLSAALFSRCDPGKPEDVRRLTGCPECIADLRDEEFIQKLRAITFDIVANSDAPTSPIVEAIWDIGKLFRESSAASRRFINFSDLLQNTTEYTHYRTDRSLKFEIFRDSNYAKRWYTSLREVSIDVYYVMRDTPLARSVQSQNNHIQFWLTYFEDLGATVRMVSKVQ